MGTCKIPGFYREIVPDAPNFPGFYKAIQRSVTSQGLAGYTLLKAKSGEFGHRNFQSIYVHDVTTPQWASGIEQEGVGGKGRANYNVLTVKIRRLPSDPDFISNMQSFQLKNWPLMANATMAPIRLFDHQYSTDDFGFWLPGICTDTNYATNTAAAITTTAGGSPTAVVGITSNPTGTASGGAGVSSSPTATPGGLISTTTSKPTAITPAPTGTSAGAVGGVSSTISKADGMKIGYMSGDGSFWSIFGSILGAILML
ncbi:hypothetical protein G7Y89_g13826 [Cudoniella acicularis]|uniref:Uncharacterized protein n=1 Tax=Cudoniella acicularis TaxID=354080 RepID=A0A8H4VYB0_9HELO|nr:hypothetical protein G7Y89_g13826 [Cudoniella acicularis]